MPQPLIALARLLTALLVVTGVMVATNARAGVCEPPAPAEVAPPTFGETIDKAFGDWLVAPLGSVLFYDLVFWDDTLPLGDVPAQTDPATLDDAARAAWTAEQLARSGPELMSYRDGEGYVYRCRQPARLRDVTPVLGDGASVKQGLLTLSLSERDGKLFGAWGDTPVDPVGLGLVPAEGTDPDATRPGTTKDVAADGERVLKQVELEALAPFPVVVDLTEGVVRAGEVGLPWSTVPVVAGQQVLWQGKPYQVAAAVGRRLSLRSNTDEIDAAPLPNPKALGLPAVVVWLVLGAAFFTVRFAFINVRGFWHAIMVITGRYDDEHDEGEVSHFQALSSALSATVGLGNIAGVAVAVAVGGPGAVVWMVIAALLGMTSKFTEVTLGQMYREVKSDGTVSGGPMHYLSKGLKEMRLGALGAVLSVVFAVMCIGGSLGGGNMFQGNQSFQAIADVAPLLQPKATAQVVFQRLPGETGDIELPARTAVAVPGGATYITGSPLVLAAGQASTAPTIVTALQGGYESNGDAGTITQVAGIADNLGRVLPSPLDDQVTVVNGAAATGGASYGLFYGIIMTVVVGMVIVGGIKRIGATAGLIVPAMGVLYVLAGVYILVYSSVSDPGSVMAAAATLFTSAFDVQAGFGGVVGVLIVGFQRASFSNEAGVGSASIAHSAAATDEPVREGIVALLEPFIDTLIVCSITGLVVVVTGAYQIAGISGISMTSAAFESGGLPGARYVLALAVLLFAFSTMISWSYYGERAATWLFGDWASLPYKVLFLVCVMLGPVFTLGNVIDFSDLMILGMAFPNILGLYLLSGKVAKALKIYMDKLNDGTFEAEIAAAKARDAS